MPHGFEYIVRPFVPPGSLGQTVIPGTPERTEELARIVWGGKGTMPNTKVVNPSETVNVCHENAKELGRERERVRIIGNDGESYVDVDRVKSMKLDKTETTSDQSLETWQGFTIPKRDPRLQDDPNFKPAAEKEAPRRCALGWSFQPSIGTPF